MEKYFSHLHERANIQFHKDAQKTDHQENKEQKLNMRIDLNKIHTQKNRSSND